MYNPFILLLFLLFQTVLLFSCGMDEDDITSPETTPYTFNVPSYFGQVPQPADNIATQEGVALGKKLFFDPILSRDFTISCSSCHHPDKAFSDGFPIAVGINGRLGKRNTQPLINLAWQTRFFWDGRALTLENQALHPVRDPNEMDFNWTEAAQRLRQHPEYPELFRRAFPHEAEKGIDSMLVGKALAQFMRTLISANSKFDKYLRGEAMLTPQEMRGLDLFRTERADCFHCHLPDGNRQFSDFIFHNIGLDPQEAWQDSGLFYTTGQPFHIGMFKTPTLRNIALTAPYMHDGRFASLEEVIEHYDFGGHPSSTTDPLMKFVGTGLQLEVEDKAALLAFLHTLTDESFGQD